MRSGLKFLAQLSELDVDWLLTVGESEDVQRGCDLIAKGQTAADLILILGGTARVHDPDTSAEIARIGKGELVGEISFIDSEGATASVTAVETLRIFRLKKHRLDEKLARDPVFASRFFKLLAGFLSSRLRGMLSPASPEGPDNLDQAETEVLARARLDRLLQRFDRRPVVELNGQDLTIEQVVAVAVDRAKVSLTQTAIERIAGARAVVDHLAHDERPIYGVNTGVGALRGNRITPEETGRFQSNILRSHAVGIPPDYTPEICRAIVLARINGMARGGAGISPHVLQRLLDLLNADVPPVIPSRGSVGMADLAPLAHMALPVIGEGWVWHNGERVEAAGAIARLGLLPVELGAKDGISLVSANSAAVGHAALVLARMLDMLCHADVAAALSIDAFRANPSPLDERILTVRPHQGQVLTTLRLRALLEGSACHDPANRRNLQDPISFRCIPQVHGPCQEMLAVARRVIEMELNSTGDNPVVLAESNDIVSNGNFHPAGVAIALETLSLSITHLASIATSRTLRLNDEAMTGLPAQLVANPGLNTGMGVLQKTISALNANVRFLASPASLDFLPVAGSIEDHSTMATAVVSKLEQQIEATEHILAIEMLTAAQAIDLRSASGLGRGSAAAYSCIRRAVPFMAEDRNISMDVAAVTALLRDGSLLGGVAEEGGVALAPRG